MNHYLISLNGLKINSRNTKRRRRRRNKEFQNPQLSKSVFLKNKQML